MSIEARFETAYLFIIAFKSRLLLSDYKSRGDLFDYSDDIPYFCEDKSRKLKKHRRRKNMRNDLFRKDALDGIASPERVDQYIHVSSISTFVILGALFLFMVGVLVWGFCGHVSESVTIKGVVFPFEGTRSVTLPEDGVTRELYVKRGDYVRAGDRLALVSVNQRFSLLISPYEGTVLSAKERSTDFAAYEPIVNLFRQDSARRNREIVAVTSFENLRKLKDRMPVQVSPIDLPREKYGYMRGRIVEIADYPLSRQEALEYLKVDSYVSDIFPEKEEATYVVRILLEEDPERPGKILWSHAREEEQKIAMGTFCDIQIVTRRLPVYRKLFEEIDEKARAVRLWVE